MNDHGLYFDFFSTMALEVERSKDKPDFQGPMTDTMAATCGTVQEVIDFFGKYNLSFMRKTQMFIVDQTGDAAIIEGDEIIRKTLPYQIVTNFYQSQVAENRRPCEWYKPSCMQYKRAEKMLLKGGDISVPLFRDILEATRRNISFSITLYSTVYDLKKRLIYLYYLQQFDKEVVIDVDVELDKGPHYFNISSMFGKELKYRRKTFTNDSPAFSVSYPSEFKVTETIGRNEVFRAKCAHASTPIFIIYVHDKPKGLSLQDLGKDYFLPEISTLGTEARLVSNKITKIANGVLANEIQIDWVTDHYPVKSLIVSTYCGDKLISAMVTSRAHPEALKDFLYSLRLN
jgi:hypothetical protein